MTTETEQSMAEPADTIEPESDDDRRSAANREAAARRVQLREVENERDELRERVTTLTRTAVEHLIEQNDKLPQPHRIEDLWEVIGLTLEDVTDELGTVDPERLRAALEAASGEREYLFTGRKHIGGGPLHQVRSNATPMPLGYNPNKTGGAAWQDAHKKALHP